MQRFVIFLFQNFTFVFSKYTTSRILPLACPFNPQLFLYTPHGYPTSRRESYTPFMSVGVAIMNERKLLTSLLCAGRRNLSDGLPTVFSVLHRFCVFCFGSLKHKEEQENISGIILIIILEISVMSGSIMWYQPK